MDLNADLAEQLRLVDEFLRIADDEGEIDTHDAIRLAELVLALNGWVAGGGFLPKAWTR